MKLRSTKFIVLAAVACSGCASLNDGSRVVENPAFTEQEIRSKVWDDANGHRVQLVDWSVIDFKLRGGLLIAKYGDPKTRSVTCLEFYRVIQRDDGSLLVSSASPNAASNTVVLPKNQTFVLLEHDSQPGKVTSVEPFEHGSSVGVVITREMVGSASTQREGMRYALRYGEDFTMDFDLYVGTWTIGQETQK